MLALRAAQSRALLTTLLLSFGVPMLLGGDELGRTQGGNNNAYCQDNATTWFDWSNVDGDLLAFTRRLIALRHAHPAFRRRRFLVGAEAAQDLRWFTPSRRRHDRRRLAQPRRPQHRHRASTATTTPTGARTARSPSTTTSLVLINGWWEPLTFVVPTIDGVERTWRVELDSYDLAASPAPAPERRSGSKITLGPQSIVVLTSGSDRTDTNDNNRPVEAVDTGAIS